MLMSTVTIQGREADITHEECGRSFHHVHIHADKLENLDYCKPIQYALSDLLQRYMYIDMVIVMFFFKFICVYF